MFSSLLPNSMVSDGEYAGHSESAFRITCIERRHFSTNIGLFMIALLSMPKTLSLLYINPNGLTIIAVAPAPHALFSSSATGFTHPSERTRQRESA
jgi:hypothetical protein